MNSLKRQRETQAHSQKSDKDDEEIWPLVLLWAVEGTRAIQPTEDRTLWKSEPVLESWRILFRTKIKFAHSSPRDRTKSNGLRKDQYTGEYNRAHQRWNRLPWEKMNIYNRRCTSSDSVMTLWGFYRKKSSMGREMDHSRWHLGYLPKLGLCCSGSVFSPVPVASH